MSTSTSSTLATPVYASPIAFSIFCTSLRLASRLTSSGTSSVGEAIRLIERIVNLLHHLLLRVPACSERRIDGEYGHFLISLLVVGKPTLGQYICILGKTKYLVGMT